MLVTSQKCHFTVRTLYTKISKTYFRDGFSSVYRLGAALQEDTESGTQSGYLQTGDKFIFKRSQQYVAVVTSIYGFSKHATGAS